MGQEANLSGVGNRRLIMRSDKHQGIEVLRYFLQLRILPLHPSDKALNARVQTVKDDIVHRPVRVDHGNRNLLGTERGRRRSTIYAGDNFIDFLRKPQAGALPIPT